MSETKNKILNGLNAYTPYLRENLKKTFPAANKISITGGEFNFNSETGVANFSIPSGVKNISVTGGDYSFDTETKVANITIPSSANVSVNGYEVGNIIFSGGEQLIDNDNKVANVTIPSAAKFTVNGAAANGIFISGADYNLDSETKVANFTIPAAQNFTVNGAEANAVSIAGADFNFDTETKVANFSISGGAGGGVQNVSIVGGAMNASITGDTLYLLGADATPKSSANFNLAIDADTLMANVNATVTASHDGDGVVSYFANPFVTVEPITTDKFKIRGKKPCTTDIGFSLSETANYYAAAKKIPLTFTENPAILLMHFDDASDIFKNEGTGNFTIPQADAAIKADEYKFGAGCLYCNVSSNPTITNFYLGGQDFTVDFWQKPSNGDVGTIVLKGFKAPFRVDFGEYSGRGEVALFDSPSNDAGGGEEGYKSMSSGTQCRYYKPFTQTTDWSHIAFSYQYDEKIMYAFVNGELVVAQKNTTLDRAAMTISFGNGGLMVDEMRILDGYCEYTDNFTPPTEPY